MKSDPIADMLTRIRNARQARRADVDIPASALKTAIARILKDEGYVEDYQTVEDDKQNILRVTLRTGAEGLEVLQGLQRVSRPGRRVYVGKNHIPKVQAGLGINILSTSKGVMTGQQATEQGVGGEILCNVW